jgi:predicted GH43/DUF377 family glycosyl hydrolase
MKIKKHALRLLASPEAVITLFLHLPGEDRVAHVVQRVKNMREPDVHVQMEKIMSAFGNRHRHLREIFLDHFHQVEDLNGSGLAHFSMQRQLLLGAYFTKEYSIQAAALFNPSIVPHPEQDGLQPGEQRFVMSMRATGEGHISSIVFGTGVVDQHGIISLDPRSGYHTRLGKIGHPAERSEDAQGVHYALGSQSTVRINEQVIFPYSREESMGMEDLRLVKFEDKGRTCYYGTYTAYDGRQIRTQLIETEDFYRYTIRSLSGPAISDKGMALFPEKIKGQFAMISRQGGEKMQIMFSDDLYRWETFQVLLEPRYDWELVQTGNCGSPIKTAKGWLLLTHGVGAMRRYTISALLLDLKDPTRIVGRLNKPLIEPEGSEREGYVPNVVYTCGWMRHGGLLIIPYAVSDSATLFATLVLDELLKEFEHSTPSS